MGGGEAGGQGGGGTERFRRLGRGRMYAAVALVALEAGRGRDRVMAVGSVESGVRRGIRVFA